MVNHDSQIGLPNVTALLLADRIIITRFAIKHVQKFGHTQLTSCLAPTIELGQKIFALVGAVTHRRVKIFVGIRNSYLRQFFRTETANRTHHDGGKRNILAHVVQQIQQACQNLNLRRPKKIFLVGHVSRHSEFFQRVKNFKRLRLRRTMQNHNVLEFNGAITFAVAHEFLRGNQLVNFIGDKAHFKLNFFAVVVDLFFLLEDKKFWAFVKIIFADFITCAEFKLSLLVVFNFGRL